MQWNSVDRHTEEDTSYDSQAELKVGTGAGKKMWWRHSTQMGFRGPTALQTSHAPLAPTLQQGAAYTPK